MALNDFLVELDRLVGDATAAFQAAADADALEAVRIEFLGAKSGRLKAVQKGLGLLTGRIGRRGGNGSIRSSRRSKPRTAAASNRWRPARKRPAGPPGRSSIPRCPARPGGWATCTRSHKRLKS